MREATIFYSWQSDDSKTRWFIEKQIKSAIAHMSEDPSLSVAPRVDKDTQGMTGAVEIAKTILEKIERSDIFIADVSLIGKSENGRSLVNQNVLFELGFAVSELGNENIILVANDDLGDINDLPFDIRGRRVARFSMDADPKGEKFAKDLEQILLSHLGQLEQQNVAVTATSLRQHLVEAIEGRSPTRSKAEAYFKEKYEEILSKAPPRYKGKISREEYGGLVFESYSNTKAIVQDIASVLSIAAEYNDEKTLITAYKSLEMITKYYDVLPEDNGQMYHDSIEFYSLVWYEIISLIIGYMAKERLWGMIELVKNLKFKRPPGFDDDRKIGNLYFWPEDTLAHYNSLKGVKYSIPISIILEERWSDSTDVLKVYVDGSVLLYLVEPSFYPWSAGLLLNSATWKEFAPEYIGDLRRKNTIDALSRVAELTPDELKEQIDDRVGRELVAVLNYHFRDLSHVFAYYEIKNKDDLGKN